MALEIEGYDYITHKIVQRPWGKECRFTVKGTKGNIDDVISVAENVTDEELVLKIKNHAEYRERQKDREDRTCQVFDNTGPEVRQALNWIVRYIKANPTKNKSQVKQAFGNAFTTSVFDFDNFVDYLIMQTETGKWSSFVVYVTNHFFEEID